MVKYLLTGYYSFGGVVKNPYFIYTIKPGFYSIRRQSQFNKGFSREFYSLGGEIIFGEAIPPHPLNFISPP